MKSNKLDEVEALKAKIEVLENENQLLTEGAEDTLLLRIVAEQIALSDDSHSVIQLILEKISILKDFAYCAFFSIENSNSFLIAQYASFTNDLVPCQLRPLEKGLWERLQQGIIVHRSDDSIVNLAVFEPYSFAPKIVAFVPLISREYPLGLFVFISDEQDEQRVHQAENLLEHIVELVVYKIDELDYKYELAEMNKELEKRVEERTAQLEAEMEERIRTERELSAAEIRFREIFNNANDAIYLWLVNDDGDVERCVEVNDVATKMLGYTRDELLRMTAKDINLPDSTPQQGDVLSTILDAGQYEFQTTHVQKDGSTVPVEISSHAYRSENNNYIISIVRDISRRVEANEKLRLSEKKFSQAFHISPDSININRLSDGLFLEINEGFSKILGYKLEDIIGKSSLELDIWVDPDDRSTLIAGLENEGEVTNLEAEFKTKEGNIKTGLMSAKILEIGGELCVLSITRDITDRKQTEEENKTLHKELLSAYDDTLNGWSRALNFKDSNTDRHSRRVVDLTLKLAKRMNFAAEKLIHVKRGAVLHDIGKMGIPDNLLSKAGPLTDEEWQIMKKHPVYAFEMLSEIPFLVPAMDIPYCHHENWDGSGYPRGLSGEDIPLSARIFSVIDAYDALSFDRPYRKALPKDEIYQIIQDASGTKFDPAVVEQFLLMQAERDKIV